jgi:DNA polymerase
MSVIHLHLDFETRSLLDIRKVGLDNYARNAEVLMLAWAVNDQIPQIWLPTDGPMPSELAVLLCNPGAIKHGWNCAFERAIFKHCLGINSPISQWLDPSVIARYAGLPGKLALVSEFMKLGDKGKDKDGKRLINKFSKPYRGAFRRPEDHPEDWEKFMQYCRQDVVAERVIFHRLKDFFMPPASEIELWRLDAEINERGMPVSMEYVKSSVAAVEADRERLGVEFHALTGLANPNSTAQLLPWLKDRGYPFSSLGAKKVARALDFVSERDKVTTGEKK